MRKVNAIIPEEFFIKRAEEVADEMIVAMNELLVENLNSDCVGTVTLSDLLDRFRKLREDREKSTRVNTRWLDIEPIYRKKGWIVKTDKARILFHFERDNDCQNSNRNEDCSE